MESSISLSAEPSTELAPGRAWMVGHRGWRRFAARGMVALSVAGMGLLVANSSVFHVRTIDVTGASHLTRADVRRMSGLGRETNVVWLDADGVERRIERSPWILRARVQKSFPSEVRIEIVERSPVAVVVEGSVFRRVSGDGIRLDVVEADPHSLPLIVPGARAAAGSFVAAPPGLTGAARVLDAMSPLLRARVEKVLVGPTGGLELRLTGGITVAYGRAEDTAAKAGALRALLRWLDRETVSVGFIDVTSPGAPTVRLTGMSEVAEAETPALPTHHTGTETSGGY